jgi:cation transport ATPase
MVTAFSGCICLSVPYLTCLADSIAISKVCKKLRNKGAVLSGWQAFSKCENANALAIDSADIFDKEGGNVYGIHPFYDIGIDEAIIYTASLLIASGGPLGNLFNRVIVGEKSLLPPVDTLAYEDKLGLSAWIFNRRILVGNGDLLRNHNVEIPDMALIERHLCEGRYPLYLSVDGKAAAVFIVSYDVNKNIGLYFNCNNITDCVYYSRVGGNGDFFGDPRNFTLSVKCSF